MAENAKSFVFEIEATDVNPAKRRIPRKKGKSFVERLKEKYCSEQPTQGHGFVIVYNAMPKTEDGGELGHLRTVVSSFCDLSFYLYVFLLDHNRCSSSCKCTVVLTYCTISKCIHV